MADTLAATRLKQGMIIKLDNDLLRILDLEHVTPGNLRGFVRVKTRNLRSQTMLGAASLRSEDVIERATLDEKRDAVPLQRRRRTIYFMDTSSYEQIHLTAEALGDSVGFLKPEMTIRVEFYGERAGRHRAAADRRPEGASRRCRRSRAPPPPTS